MQIALLESAARRAPMALGAALFLAGSAAAAAPQAKPDQVFRLNERTQKTQAIVCTVNTDGLGKVEVTRRDGRDLSIDSLEVVEIVWGDVPNTFSDGATYAKRGDWESAVKSFQEAAGDSDTRGPVAAAARFHAIESLVQWGASDPSRFADAVSEADRYLVDHSDNRRVPAVRALKARAAWLSGNAEAARDGYRALYETGKGGADGYAPLATADAALQGAYAAIDAGDNIGARGLFDEAAAAFGAIESETPAVAAAAAAGAEIAAMGEAITQVHSGEASKARRTFENAAKNSKTSGAIAAARLGMGYVHLADEKYREAQFEFAWVAGLDHTSADRRAEALLGLAQATRQAGGDGAEAQARAAVSRILAQYGATPAAAAARKL